MGVSVVLAAALLVAAPAQAQSEPRLTALDLSDVDIGTFSGETFEYSAEIANTVSSTTVTATPSDGATVDISPGDADTVTGGHQIALSDGSNRITVTVESADGTATKRYKIRVDRESTADFGWTVLEDVKTPLLSDERGARGLWSDGDTLWTRSIHDGVIAYDFDTGARSSASDIDTMAHGNDFPEGMWSDGTIMWVSDFHKAKLFAYVLATGVRDSSLDFNTLAAVGITKPAGLWSDGTTMWVADYWDDDRFYSFNMPSGGI